MAFAGNNAYLIDIQGMLRIYDLNQQRLCVGSYQLTNYFLCDIAVSGNYAFIANGASGLLILNISNPATPTVVGSLSTMQYAYKILLTGNYVYITDSNSGLTVINISNPAAPTMLWASGTTNGAVNDFIISGGYAYVVSSLSDANGSSTLMIYDVRTPSSITEVGSMTFPEIAFGIALSGNYAYITGNRLGLRVINISDPTAPTAAASHYRVLNNASDIVASGQYAYVADNQFGLRIFDVSHPATLALTHSISIGNAVGVSLHDNYAYVAASDSGLRIVNISNPLLPINVGYRDTSAAVKQVVISGNYAYTIGGSRLRILNISNPEAPVLIGSCELPYDANELKVIGNYAYIADGAGGLRIIDISNSKAPSEIGSFANSSSDLLHIAISGNFAYLSENQYRLRILDISNPRSPTQVSLYSPSGSQYVAISDNSAILFDSTTTRLVPIAALLNPGFATNFGGVSPNSFSINGNNLFDAFDQGFNIYDCSEAMNVGERSDETLPARCVLKPSYPNPFNATTEIRYQLTRAGKVELKVFDLSGREIANLVNDRQEPCEYRIPFNGKALVSGTYLVRLTSGTNSHTQKIVLLK